MFKRNAKSYHYEGLTDEQLFQLVAEQDALAYEQIYTRYAQIVYSLLMRMVDDVTHAEELLIDVFSVLWTQASQLRHPNQSPIWLLHLARKRALALCRQQKQLSNKAPLFAELPPPAEQDAMARFTMLAQRQYDQIGNRLPDLAPEEHRCLELAYFEGMNRNEIAQSLELSPKMVSQHLQQAVEKLDEFVQ